MNPKSILLISFITLILLAFGSTIAVRSYTQRTQMSTAPVAGGVNQTGNTNEMSIKIEVVSPLVQLQKPNTNTWEDAVNDQVIVTGTKVKTGDRARALIVFPDKTVTRLDSNSEIVLNQFQASPQIVSIGLQFGRIWSRVAKLFGQESYQTQTNSVIATVRGTSYGQEKLKNGQDKIITTKSSVEAKCFNSSEKTVVSKNYKAILGCSFGEKIQPQALTDDDLKDDFVKFNIEQDKVVNQKYGVKTFDDEQDVLGVQASPSVQTNQIKDRPSSTKISTPTPTSVSTNTTTSQNNTQSTSQSTNPVQNTNSSPNAVATPVPTQTPTTQPTTSTQTQNPTFSNSNLNYPANYRYMQFQTPTPTPTSIR